MESVSNERLINEVKNYPFLYNVRDPNYKDLSQKRTAWEAICSDLLEGEWVELPLKEKNDALKEVQKRWKSLRDSFTRAWKLKHTNESGKKKKPYIYSSQMRFLIPFVVARSGLGIDEMETLADVKRETKSSPGQIQKLNRSPQLSIEEIHRTKRKAAEPYPAERTPNDSKKTEDDPDRMFLLSLLPNYKKIKAEDKLDVQIEILQCIKRRLNS